MLKKILIANRGEIACRVIRTAKRLGIATVAVYSDADANSQHKRQADESVRLPGNLPRETYLVIANIIAAAKKTGAAAIHPGYGFLSENAAFAQACRDAGIVFIGPPPSAIEAMGSKAAAKRLMETAGVPLVPGYHGKSQDDALLLAESKRIGYPVLLKAAAGGGGKGMRAVSDESEFASALVAARREATNSFGDDTMIIEKYLQRPRHVEVQVFCDSHGNGIYLFERDCSIQRRHQKIVEEAPAPGMTQELRSRMGDAAVKAARAIGYEGAGTIEFLLDVTGEFYFMEMNTRLQVEHPVTEMITGQDLVEWQIRVAAGDKLPRSQEQLQINGHAIEVRICAEDTEHQFLPSTGTLSVMHVPRTTAEVRLDTGVVEGDAITPFYDPMIAKLICHGSTREEAAKKLVQALHEFRIAGVATNIGYLNRIVGSAPFLAADLDTRFIERHAELLAGSTSATSQAALVAATHIARNITQGMAPHAGNLRHANSADRYSPWNAGDGWEPVGARMMPITLRHRDDWIRVSTLHNPDQKIADGDDAVLLERDGVLHVWLDAEHFAFGVPVSFHHAGDDQHGHDCRAPMHGRVVAVNAKPGDDVKKGQPLVIMEAMKMEHTICAPADGRVAELLCEPGALVDEGATLLSFEETA